jgi:hypothetical protein
MSSAKGERQRHQGVGCCRMLVNRVLPSRVLRLLFRVENIPRGGCGRGERRFEYPTDPTRLLKITQPCNSEKCIRRKSSSSEREHGRGMTGGRMAFLRDKVQRYISSEQSQKRQRERDPRC